MLIDLDEIIIRDFTREDAQLLHKIVREKEIFRFMKDWAEKCGFELFEKRFPIGHIQPNMESDSYYYYRRYRK